MAAEKMICAACLDNWKVEIMKWFTTIIPSLIDYFGAVAAFVAYDKTIELSVDGQVQQIQGELDDKKRLSDQALAQVNLLNQQISALRRQIDDLFAARAYEPRG